MRPSLCTFSSCYIIGMVMLITFCSCATRYTSPPDPVAALQEAASNISFSDGVTLNDAIEEFLSGPRTLSPFKLSHLRVLRQPTGSLAGSPDREIVGMLWMGAHYTTGGTGIHAAYNEFYTLLGSHLSEYELSQLLLSDWAKRWDRGNPMEVAVFKAPSDATIGVPKGRLQAAALALDRELVKANDIVSQIPLVSRPPPLTALIML